MNDMAYIEILLRQMPVTERQKRALIAGTTHVVQLLDNREWTGTVISVEHATGVPPDADPARVVVRIRAAPHNITASDRAQITSAMVDMLQRTLAKDRGLDYAVIIEETACDTTCL